MRTDYDEADVGRLIDHLADRVTAAFPAADPINVVGIRTRGEVLAHRLVERLGERGYGKVGRGTLDITLYRDDLSEIGPRPLVRPSHLAIQVDGVPLLLVDDVIFTGRSVRAALNLLNDFGRPSAVRLAVLVDRGGRELPIQPDIAALTLPAVPLTHKVSVKLKEVDGEDGIVVDRRA
ncbi:MAG: Bifunctional protein pyrR [Phycisphaerales bacterium]|nr:Bifunctional protein pyrR [Phycisphaerales bacterium]